MVKKWSCKERQVALSRLRRSKHTLRLSSFFPPPQEKNLTRIRKASERNLPSQCSSDRTGCTIPHSPKNCAARYCMRESKTSNYTRRSIQVSPMPFPVPFPFPAFLLLSFSQRPPPPSRTTAWTGEEVKGTGTGMIFAKIIPVQK